MARIISLCRFAAPLCLLALCFSGVGCSTVESIPLLDSMLVDRDVEDLDQQRGPAVVVFIKDAQDQVEHTVVPLEASMTVQTALEKSNAVNKFRRLHVRVLRMGVSPDTGKNVLQTMTCEYDGPKKQVSFLTDFELQPNDRVVCEEDTTTAFDDMMESVGKPMQMITGGRR
jgi:hypothetical protein